jgi:prepilin-type N-terminal cleavage/methylation domain-containing protein/prepilin-type processing-associated H-X9-DG protein
MRFPNNRKYSKAFTLVELLVVISVIGLLMGILVPALGKARGTANRTYCMSNLRQLGVGMRSYLDGNNDKFPLCCANPWDITDANNPDYAPPITKVLGPILKEPKVFICKADNVKKYYLRVGNTSYWYKGRPQPPSSPLCYLRDGLGGITIRESCEVQGGAKEKDIEVMSDFDPVHPGKTGTFRLRQGQKNYLYADWHVSNYVKQE